MRHRQQNDVAAARETLRGGHCHPDQLSKVSVRQTQELLLLRGCQQQQILGQADQSLGLLRRDPDGGPQLLLGPARTLRELQLPLEHGQRRPQLMPGVCHETPFTF